MKQLKWSYSYHPGARIIRVGDSFFCLFVCFTSLHLWIYSVIFVVVIFKFVILATFINIYLSVILLLHDCLTICDASGAKTWKNCISQKVRCALGMADLWKLPITQVLTFTGFHPNYDQTFLWLFTSFSPCVHYWR